MAFAGEIAVCISLVYDIQQLHETALKNEQSAAHLNTRVDIIANSLRVLEPRMLRVNARSPAAAVISAALQMCNGVLQEVLDLTSKVKGKGFKKYMIKATSMLMQGNLKEITEKLNGVGIDLKLVMEMVNSEIIRQAEEKLAQPDLDDIEHAEDSYAILSEIPVLFPRITELLGNVGPEAATGKRMDEEIPVCLPPNEEQLGNVGQEAATGTCLGEEIPVLFPRTEEPLDIVGQEEATCKRMGEVSCFKVNITEDDNSDADENALLSPTSIPPDTSRAPTITETGPITISSTIINTHTNTVSSTISKLELDPTSIHSQGREYKSRTSDNKWHLLNENDTFEDFAALMASVGCGSTFSLGGSTLRSSTKSGAMNNGLLTINLDGAVLKGGTIELQKGEQLVISGQNVHLLDIKVVGLGTTVQSIATRVRLSKDKDKEKVNGLVKLTGACDIKLTNCEIKDMSSAATYALCVEEGSSATLDKCVITGISGGTGVLVVGTSSSVIIVNGSKVEGCKRAGVAALRGGSITCMNSRLEKNDGDGAQVVGSSSSVKLIKCNVKVNKGYGVALFEGGTGELDCCEVMGNTSGGLFMSNRPTKSSLIDRLGNSFLSRASEFSVGKEKDVGSRVSDRRSEPSWLARKYSNTSTNNYSNYNMGLRAPPSGSTINSCLSPKSNTSISTSSWLARSVNFPVNSTGGDASQPTFFVPGKNKENKSPFSVVGKVEDFGQTSFSMVCEEAPQEQVQTFCKLLSCTVMGNNGNGLTLEGCGTKGEATKSNFCDNDEYGVAALESAHVVLTSCDLEDNKQSGLLVQQAASAKAGQVAATEALLTEVSMLKNKKHGARVVGTDTSVTFMSSKFNNNCKSGLLVTEGGHVHASGSEFNCNAVSGISLRGGHTIALKCECNENKAGALMATTGAKSHFTECTLNAYNKSCITITEKAVVELLNCKIGQEPVLQGGSVKIRETD